MYLHAAVMYLPQVGTIVTRWLLISMTLHPETLPDCAGLLSDEELAWQLQQQLDLEDAAAMSHHSQPHSSQPHTHDMPPGFSQHHPAYSQPALVQQAQHGTAARDTGLRQGAGSHDRQQQQQQQPEAVSAGQAIAMSMFSYGGDLGEDDQGDGGRFGERGCGGRGRRGGGGRRGGSRGRGRSLGR